MTIETDDYRRPGRNTLLRPDHQSLTAGLPDDPVALCAVAQGLVIQPDDATAAGLPEARLAEKNLRPVSEILDVVATLDPAPLHRARTPEQRVVGTCRHFAVLACALLRHRGIPARARCGFATYFVPDRYVDHWIIDYWHPDERRWVRVDSEILGGPVLSRPEDLAVGQFLTGGEAWRLYRDGEADGRHFGVVGADWAWGPAEIRGNAIRDLASVRKVETLPWDEWGRMTASYAGETGPEYDELIDAVAATCAADDADALAALYATADLAAPATLGG